jgi:pimeloyl-ACP methyl ester carboxylesterase
MQITEHYIYRRDGRVYFYKVGHDAYAAGPDSRDHGLPESGEPLIFMHALGSSGALWGPVVDILQDRFSCYVIDLPGHVHSDVPPRKYNISDFATSVLDVMDAIGLKQANLVGYHTGAMVALELAISHQARVKKLVLDCLPYWNKDRGLIMWERAFIPGFTDKTSYDVPVEEDNTPNQPRLWYRLGHEATTSYDTDAAGPRVNVPTLLVYGEGDTMRRGEQRAQDGIKGSTYKLIVGSPGGGYKKPEEFAQLTTDFLLDNS